MASDSPSLCVRICPHWSDPPPPLLRADVLCARPHSGYYPTQMTSSEVDSGYYPTQMTSSEVDSGYYPTQMTSSEVDSGYYPTQMTSSEVDSGILSNSNDVI